MIAFLDVTYTDPASGAPIDGGWDGSLTREPEPVPDVVDEQLRVHARRALARVGWPPERPDDYDLETTR